jgi:hypothetical protein
MFVLYCVGSGLVTGSSPIQGVLPTVHYIIKLKKRPRSKRAVEPNRKINENAHVTKCSIYFIYSGLDEHSGGICAKRLGLTPS